MWIRPIWFCGAARAIARGRSGGIRWDGCRDDGGDARLDAGVRGIDVDDKPDNSAMKSKRNSGVPLAKLPPSMRVELDRLADRTPLKPSEISKQLGLTALGVRPRTLQLYVFRRRRRDFLTHGQATRAARVRAIATSLRGAPGRWKSLPRDTQRAVEAALLSGESPLAVFSKFALADFGFKVGGFSRLSRRLRRAHGIRRERGRPSATKRADARARALLVLLSGVPRGDLLAVLARARSLVEGGDA